MRHVMAIINIPNPYKPGDTQEHVVCIQSWSHRAITAQDIIKALWVQHDKMVKAEDYDFAPYEAMGTILKNPIARELRLPTNQHHVACDYLLMKDIEYVLLP